MSKGMGGLFVQTLCSALPTAASYELPATGRRRNAPSLGRGVFSWYHPCSPRIVAALGASDARAVSGLSGIVPDTSHPMTSAARDRQATAPDSALSPAAARSFASP